MNIKTFNTGRHYSVNGQVIEWYVKYDKTYFDDKTRMIKGVIDKICYDQYEVLDWYDNGLYTDN